MTDTKTIRAITKTMAIECCQEWLSCEMSEGVRATIPGTSNLIMVGPADWIAKHVEGQAVAAATNSYRGVIAAGEYDRETQIMFVTVKLPRAGLPTELLTIGAEASISADASPAVAAEVPAGFVLVPNVDGDQNALLQMGWAYLDAARAAEPEKTWLFSHAGYAAMLAAAPTPPAPATVAAELPAILFDGHAVYKEVMANDPNTPRPTADNIANTLDAVVRIMRREGWGQGSAARDQAQPDIFAVQFIEQRAQQYLQDHADSEPETGALVFEFGEAGRDYHSTLVELADDIRAALRTAPSEAGKGGSE